MFSATDKWGYNASDPKYHAHTAFGGRNVVHPGLPDKQVTTGDGFKSGDHTQQGRLTAA